MTSSAVALLASRILEREAQGALGPDALVRGVEGALGKLAAELESVIGPGGAFAVIRRGLVLAKREHACLNGVDPSEDGQGRLPTLADALLSCPEQQRVAACTTIITQSLGVLVSLMGEDLGLRAARDIWPDVIVQPTESMQESE